MSKTKFVQKSSANLAESLIIEIKSKVNSGWYRRSRRYSNEILLRSLMRSSGDGRLSEMRRLTLSMISTLRSSAYTKSAACPFSFLTLILEIMTCSPSTTTTTFIGHLQPHVRCSASSSRKRVTASKIRWAMARCDRKISSAACWDKRPSRQRHSPSQTHTTFVR